MSSDAPRRIGIVGLGLVGGSLARALKRHDASYEIVGLDASASTREEALRAEAVDVALAEPSDELETCDVVVLATSVESLRPLLTSLAGHLSPAVLLTDVCGIKQPVEDLVTELLPSVDFVGGHPMAGGTKGGFGQSRSDLFTGAAVALCPKPGTEARVPEVAELWRVVGARPLVLSADLHDRHVALTSHLPYLTAVALTERLVERPEAASLGGPGLRHATRQARFAPEVMAASALRNPHLADELKKLASRLERMARQLEDAPDDLFAAATQARRQHERLLLD